jgi:hypothetical protein
MWLVALKEFKRGDTIMRSTGYAERMRAGNGSEREREYVSLDVWLKAVVSKLGRERKEKVTHDYNPSTFLSSRRES